METLPSFKQTSVGSVPALHALPLPTLSPPLSSSVSPSSVSGSGSPSYHSASKSPPRKGKRDKQSSMSLKPVSARSPLNIDINSIEICEPLGKGASSTCIHSCLVDGWKCAMKKLSTSQANKMDLTAFEREVEILCQLPPHPNIVRYLFHSHIGEDLCLFMTQYQGTLRDWLDSLPSSSSPSLEDLSRYAMDVASGLEFLHQHSVIHRDIKVCSPSLSQKQR